MALAKHFVVVHGACHGVWVYYKLKPRIEAASHWFTPVNLADSGVNEKNLQVSASVPENEKVIRIGHSS
ncbi:unnamed protein product [Ilex paraguariensis]|uniref:Uncharacterized protein n=1 Tax=Ilex paraguariensis TaxID=185542 RepID=A0ABC8TAG5_9AQUA